MSEGFDECILGDFLGVFLLHAQRGRARGRWRSCPLLGVAPAVFIPYIACPAGVSTGFVVGTSDAMILTGFAYFLIPFSGISSITPTLFALNASLSTPRTLNLLLFLDSLSPSPLSSIDFSTRYFTVSLLAIAQATFWINLSTVA